MEETSKDDTTIISELLNSAEAMPSYTVPTTDANSLEMPLQQKNELQFLSDTVGVPAIKQNIIDSLQQDPHSAVDGDFLSCSQYSDVADFSKVHSRHVHIPYILNGELYQIQTQDGENVTVKCCHCPPDRVYRGSVRSTGNFHMHIKRRHPDLLEKLHIMKVNALLERRDRLMRSRKVSLRNVRNQPINTIANLNDMCSFKNEEKLQLTTSPSSQITLDSTEPILMHTHNLKIKTVFQRHQMQQREAAEIKNFKNSEYVVGEQPINYSLKSEENQTAALELYSSNYSNVNQQPQLQQLKEAHNITTEATFDNYNNQPQTYLPSTNNDSTKQNKIMNENHTINLSTCSTSTSCSSSMSNYSGIHQYHVETNRPFNSFSHQHLNFSIIKPEHFLTKTATEAIDLTMHTDSGIFSNSEDNDSENNSDNKILNRAGFQESNNNIGTTGDTEDSHDSDTNTAKWQDLLIQVENSLRDIQREMNVRNQIESNRMFLDIAKFKFLNPGFQFNW